MTKKQLRKINRIESQAKSLEKKLVNNSLSDKLNSYNINMKSDYTTMGYLNDIGFLIGDLHSIDPNVSLRSYGIYSNTEIKRWYHDDGESALANHGGSLVMSDNPAMVFVDNQDTDSDLKIYDYFTIEQTDDSDYDLPEGCEDSGCTYTAHPIKVSDVKKSDNCVKRYALAVKHDLIKDLNNSTSSLKQSIQNKKTLINILKIKSTSAQIKAYLKYRPCAFKSVPKVLSLNKNWTHKFLKAMAYLNNHNDKLSALYSKANLTRKPGISSEDWYTALTDKLNYNMDNYYHIGRMIEQIKDYLYQAFLNHNNKLVSRSKHNQAIRLQNKIDKHHKNQKPVFREFGFINVTKPTVKRLLKMLHHKINDGFTSAEKSVFDDAYKRYNQKLVRKQTRQLNRAKRNYIHQRTVFLRKLGTLMKQY